ncbi:MAG: AAA family ATPase, partial [Candidatus Limnocylindrales bacterium]
MIGRVGEAAAVARFIERVPHGPVGLVIEGEPGIGKTTVWLEAVRLAREREYRVLQARPAESEAELSYAALADLVGGIFDEASRDLPTPQRRALEVALLRQEADERADPRTTASAFVGVLSSLTADRPLVIAVDDMQWLDPASERALEFAARRLPARVGIVVARRGQERDAMPLGLDRALDPEALERLSLGPLSLAALHQLIERVAGPSISRPVLVRIEIVSGGNPFFALETARALGRDGGLPSLSDPLPVPRSLQDLVTDRIRQLSGPAQAAALAAAALSRPTRMSVGLALALDIDGDAAILEAEEAGVLVREGDRLRFSHPLLASAMYGSAGTTQRRELHRRLADVVVDPEERARQLARGVTESDDDVASDIEQAAGLAARRGAPEAAAELYEAACRLTPERRHEDLARRMLGCAEALATAGDLIGAGSQATGALEIAPMGSLRARALYTLGWLASYTGTIDARIGYQERALAEAGEDHALRAKILLSLFEGIGADAQRATERADEAVELLRGSDDGLPLAQALMNKFVAEAILGHGARYDLLDEALALETRSEDRGLTYPLIWFHWIDDLDATRRRSSLDEELYRDRGDLVGAAEIVEFLAIAEFRAGNWDYAERALEDACATLGQLELRGPLTASFADRSLIDAHRGRIDRARTTLLDILDPGKPLDVFWRAVCHSALGAVEFCDGRNEAADRAWTAMTEEAQAVGWNDFLEDRSQPDHIETLLALGDLPRARRVLEHLEWRGRTLPRMWIDATLPRARAMILAADRK